MWHIGLDVHLRTSTLCMLDEKGCEVNLRTIKGHPRKVVEFLKEVATPFAICFEASSGYGWLYEQLRQLATRVAVAHPGQLRLIFRSKRKNDRVDARKLAKLLFLDEVPIVYVPGLMTRAWRGLIEHRHRCVASRTRTKNGIRALLRTHGVGERKGSGVVVLFTPAFRITYVYDAARRLHTMHTPGETARATWTYDAAGRQTKFEQANGTKTTHIYDAANRLTRLVNQKSDDTVISQFDYAYDNVGNRTGAPASSGS